MKKYTFIKVAGLCGILLPIVFFVSLAISMLLSPWFTWTNNALSDLGLAGASALFFNQGVLIAGILFFVFSLGLIKKSSNKRGAYFLTLSALGFIGVGLFPETMFTTHFIMAALFFISLVLSLFYIGRIGLTKANDRFERRMSILALLFAITAVCSTAFLIPLKGVAIPEAFAFFPAFAWCMIYGFEMSMHPSKTDDYKRAKTETTPAIMG
jgi:hypothetical membrane protein